MDAHPQVRHPQEIIAEAKACQSWLERTNGAVADWVTRHVAASLIVFDIAIIGPLIVLAMPMWAKVILAVISSNWFQWWALPALRQRSMRPDQPEPGGSLRAR